MSLFDGTGIFRQNHQLPSLVQNGRTTGVSGSRTRGELQMNGQPSNSYPSPQLPSLRHSGPTRSSTHHTRRAVQSTPGLEFSGAESSVVPVGPHGFGHSLHIPSPYILGQQGVGSVSRTHAESFAQTYITLVPALPGFSRTQAVTSSGRIHPAQHHQDEAPNFELLERTMGPLLKDVRDMKRQLIDAGIVCQERDRLANVVVAKQNEINHLNAEVQILSEIFQRDRDGSPHEFKKLRECAYQITESNRREKEATQQMLGLRQKFTKEKERADNAMANEAAARALLKNAVARAEASEGSASRTARKAEEL
eukprot:GDKI01018832.1.p1 GENE.GDKI01018832.1~~GDKI01018832.1.p1  ORF type:complete len:309 (-),score=-0.03 GDKI01018832.1:409-1335(-)